MKKMNKLLQVDKDSRSIKVQAGIYGPDLETLLRPYGYSLRHYPQSFEFSSVGGWVATRAGGHFATGHTHIDDFVQGVRLVAPGGVYETRRLPASGAGPNLNSFVVGSEGTLGVITEVWLRVQNIPKFRASCVVEYSSYTAAVASVRDIVQSGLTPSNCRLVDQQESMAMGLSRSGGSVLLLGFESHSVTSFDDQIGNAIRFCEERGGKVDRSSASTKQSETGAREGSAAGDWRSNFIQAPYLRNYLVPCGVIMETFETAVTWDQFPVFHKAIRKAVLSVIREQCDGLGIITCRFTHCYPDGPAPYYTVVARGSTDMKRMVEVWNTIKAAASDALIKHGGTITHHHAVGQDHRPWYAQEIGERFEDALATLKKRLDPNWILNPGVLLPIGLRSRL